MNPMLATLAVASVVAGGFTIVAMVAAARVMVRGRRDRDPDVWPDLTILTPCEGTETDLARRLASTLSARYAGAIELRIAHGGPLPEAVAALTDDPRCRSVRSPAAPARCNRKAWHLSHALGVEPAHGVVLAIDADVEVTTGLLESLVRGALRPGAVAAFAPPIQSGNDTASRVGRAALGGSAHSFAVLAGLAEISRGVPPMVGCAIAVRGDALSRAGGFDPGLWVIGDDLAIGEALGAQGAIALAPVVADCRDATQDLRALLDQLARWVRVATAHRPRVLGSYPLLIAPLPILALLTAITSLAGHAVVACTMFFAVYLLRAALALVLRLTLVGRPTEALADPLWSDMAWTVAFVRSLVARTTAWRGRSYRIGRGGRMLAPQETQK